MDFDNLSLGDITLKDLDEYVKSHGDEILVDVDTTTHSSDSKNNGGTSAKFTIVKNYGKLSDRKTAPYFTKILWGQYERYDIRKWSSDMKTPYKGIALTKPELLVMLAHYKDVVIGSEERALYKGKKADAHIYNKICTLAEAEIKDVLWSKEVSIVDWGWGKKVEIRKWADEYRKCGKGIGLTPNEYAELLKIVVKITK